MNLKTAQTIAVALCERLKPFCTVINIAGSIRRHKPDVKDIEIICLPRYISTVQENLFEEVITTPVISQNFVQVVNSLGRVIKGKPDGKMMTIELPQRINLDLFMPSSEDYYRQLCIRTGSADYVRLTIAAGWKRKGWCGSDKGLRLIKDCIEHIQPDGKSKWQCINPQPELPPHWVSEQDFFEWLGVPWIHPKLRTV